MDLDLKDRTAVVTGASAGIGRAVATALAREGARLAIVARREELLEGLADELVAEGLARPWVVTADVTTVAGHETLLAAVEEEFGHADVLVNGAGGRRPSGLSATDDQWETTLELNFSSQRKLTTRLLPGMREQGWGRIVNVTGKSEPPRVSGEFCAKAAMHAWSKGLSREVAPDGITVNCIAPGRILTEQMMRNYTEQERAAHCAEIPAGRYGRPEEIAAVATFLTSSIAGYVTGTVIAVDGGLRRFFL